jgi:hypothetical protein
VLAQVQHEVVFVIVLGDRKWSQITYTYWATLYRCRHGSYQRLINAGLLRWQQLIELSGTDATNNEVANQKPTLVCIPRHRHLVLLYTSYQ